MLRSNRLLALTVALVASAAAGPSAGAALAATTAFALPGEYAFTVPAGVTSIGVQATGAAGGGCAAPPPAATGGEAASISATIAVTPGEQLVVVVGAPGTVCSGGVNAAAGGFGGGGAGASGSVTGFSDFGAAGGGGGSLVGTAPLQPGNGILLAAGGGGGAAPQLDGGSAGGNGKPFNGVVIAGQAFGGAAGAAAAGGAGGSAGFATSGTPGMPGLAGAGGAGGSGGAWGGGGGGGGYYGGGGGGSGSGSGSGGGGSSFAAAAAAVTSAAAPTTDTPGVQITYPLPTAQVSPASLTFGTQPLGIASAGQVVAVHDTGAGSLVVSSVTVGGLDPDDFRFDDGCQAIVAPGSSCQLTVRFAPLATGVLAAALQLQTNATQPLTVVDLAGFGGPVPSLALLACRAVTHTVVHKVHGKRRRTTTTRHLCKPLPLSSRLQIRASGASVAATISRGATAYASGVSVPTAHGGSQLLLTQVLSLAHGSYTLTLATRRGGRTISQQLPITIT